MEQRGRADTLRLMLQLSTVRELDVFELLNCGEVTVYEAYIGKRPQMLGRLQLRGVGRQEEQVKVLGHPYA